MKCYGREPPKNIDGRSKLEPKLGFPKHTKTVSPTGGFQSRSAIDDAAVNRPLSVWSAHSTLLRAVAGI